MQNRSLSREVADGIETLDKCDYVFRKRRMLVRDTCPCNSGKAYKDCHGNK